MYSLFKNEIPMEEFVYNKVLSYIKQEYLQSANIKLNTNKNNTYSIIISATQTAYRNAIDNILFSRFKITGKKPYISFKGKYRKSFKKIGFKVSDINKEGYFRIDLTEFIQNETDLSDVINTIFIDSFNFDTFGCCGKYEKCSNEKCCIHDDQLYSTACMYRKNLENNRIFYGKNENIHKNVYPDKIAVLDIETPNRYNDSICSLALISTKNNSIDKYYSLVNPDTYFDNLNTSIHNITEVDVINAPTFPKVWEQIGEIFSSSLIVGHNITFDLSCIKKTMKRYGILANPVYYIDTYIIAKNCMPELKNHKLNTLCDFFQITLLQHHNALDDSLATMNLLVALISKFNINLDDYIKKYSFDTGNVKTTTVKYNDTTKYLQELQGILQGVVCDGVLNNNEILAVKEWVNTHKNLSGNYPFDKIYKSIEKVLEDNIITNDEREYLFSLFNRILDPISSVEHSLGSISLVNAKICLSGNFNSMPKNQFAKMLEADGAIIKNSVVKDLKYLIVGDNGSTNWSQGNYGSKVKSALEWNDKGKNIEIIQEKEFLKLYKN